MTTKTSYSAASGDGTICSMGMTKEQATRRATEIANQTGEAATVQGDDGSEWEVSPDAKAKLTQDQRIAVAEIADACGIDLVRGAFGDYCFEVRGHLAHVRDAQIAACREKCAEIGIDVSGVLS